MKRRENIVPFCARRLFRENEFSFVLFPPLSFPPGNTMLKRRKIIPKIFLSLPLFSTLIRALGKNRTRWSETEACNVSGFLFP